MKLFLCLGLFIFSQLSLASVQKFECENGHKIVLDFSTSLGIYNDDEIEFETRTTCGPRCGRDLLVISIKQINYFGSGLTQAILKEKINGSYLLSGSYHSPARVGPLDHPFTSTCHSEP